MQILKYLNSDLFRLQFVIFSYCYSVIYNLWTQISLWSALKKQQWFYTPLLFIFLFLTTYRLINNVCVIHLISRWSSHFTVSKFQISRSCYQVKHSVKQINYSQWRRRICMQFFKNFLLYILITCDYSITKYTNATTL